MTQKQVLMQMQEPKVEDPGQRVLLLLPLLLLLLHSLLLTHALGSSNAEHDFGSGIHSFLALVPTHQKWVQEQL